MILRSLHVLGLSAMLAATACGGSSITGGSSSEGGSSASAGKPSKGGSSASGGSNSAGGSVGTGGIVSVGGSGPQPSCQGVVCTQVSECRMGYELSRPPGACCEGCVPTPGGVACPKIACVDPVCPLGYVPGDKVGGCCTDCVPDPLFCHDATECVIADRPRPCCGCPQAITTREYAADQCWSDVDQPRMMPQSCQPQAICDAICAPCPPPGAARCIDHRCVDGDIGLK